MARVRTMLLAIVTGAGALTAAPPASSAPHEQGTLCGLTAVHQQMLTGQQMEGTVKGGPIFTHGPSSITCRVTVNGVTVAVSPTGFGAGVVTTQGPVSYAADDTDVVRICSDVTYSHGEFSVCDEITTIAVPDGLGLQRKTHNGKAHHGGGKKHPPEPPPPSPTPYRPRGTIEITSTAGIVNFAFTNFNPPFQAWTCPPATGASITCTPPAPPAGYTHNLCANVTVVTNSTVPGTANGTSACATPPHATATSTGPSSTPSQASAGPNTSFPWTCAATAIQTVVWTVRCSVGP
ncbi:MAG TPA: hypothetical protein VNA20_00390 [Frankiaceae bacterium]|nr:hypothetical protein [Frankiaceae bacterium]